LAQGLAQGVVLLALAGSAVLSAANLQVAYQAVEVLPANHLEASLWAPKQELLAC
jgi:hypothetical protein